MTRRLGVGLGLSALIVVSACSAGSELRDAVEAEREYDGTRVDGSADGWHRDIVPPDPQIRPMRTDVQLSLVEGWVFEEQSIESIEALGACDAACLEVATAFAEASANNRELDLLYRRFCDNCDEWFVALIEVEDGAARSVGRDAAIEMLQPIDTGNEVRIAFDDYDLIRRVEDGWTLVKFISPR